MQNSAKNMCNGYTTEGKLIPKKTLETVKYVHGKNAFGKRKTEIIKKNEEDAKIEMLASERAANLANKHTMRISDLKSFLTV